jgi:hypothetical protein
MIDLSQAPSQRDYSDAFNLEIAKSGPAIQQGDIAVLRETLITCVRDLQSATGSAFVDQTKQVEDLLTQYYAQTDERFNALTDHALDLEKTVDAFMKWVLLSGQTKPDGTPTYTQDQLQELQNIMMRFLQRDLNTVPTAPASKSVVEIDTAAVTENGFKVNK